MPSKFTKALKKAEQQFQDVKAEAQRIEHQIKDEVKRVEPRVEKAVDKAVDQTAAALAKAGTQASKLLERSAADVTKLAIHQTLHDDRKASRTLRDDIFEISKSMNTMLKSATSMLQTINADLASLEQQATSIKENNEILAQLTTIRNASDQRFLFNGSALKALQSCVNMMKTQNIVGQAQKECELISNAPKTADITQDSAKKIAADALARLAQYKKMADAYCKQATAVFEDIQKMKTDVAPLMATAAKSITDAKTAVVTIDVVDAVAIPQIETKNTAEDLQQQFKLMLETFEAQEKNLVEVATARSIEETHEKEDAATAFTPAATAAAAQAAPLSAMTGVGAGAGAASLVRSPETSFKA